MVYKHRQVPEVKQWQLFFLSISKERLGAQRLGSTRKAG